MIEPQDNRRVIILPRHPDDDHIPDSILNIYLAPGKIVTIQAPLFSKSMSMLSDTLKTCKGCFVAPKVEDDYQI